MMFSISDTNNFIVFKVDDRNIEWMCYGCNKQIDIQMYFNELLAKASEYIIEHPYIYDNILEIKREYMGYGIILSQLNIDDVEFNETDTHLEQEEELFDLICNIYALDSYKMYPITRFIESYNSSLC